jgi:cytochrome c6
LPAHLFEPDEFSDTDLKFFKAPSIEPFLERPAMHKMSVVVVISMGMLAFSGSAFAQGDASTLYKGKCAACHGADGTGSSVGKKLGAHDFHSPDVQAMSDEQLSEAISKGKGKMPAYEKSLKPEDIKNLASYCKALGKK